MKKLLSSAFVAAAVVSVPASAATNGSLSVTVVQNVASECGVTPITGGADTPALYLGLAEDGFSGSIPLSFVCNSRYGMDLQLKSEKSGMKEGDENGANAIDYVLELTLPSDTLTMDTAGSNDASPILNVTDVALLDPAGLTGTLSLDADGDTNGAPAYSGFYSDTITLSIDAGGSFDPNN